MFASAAHIHRMTPSALEITPSEKQLFFEIPTASSSSVPPLAVAQPAFALLVIAQLTIAQPITPSPRNPSPASADSNNSRS